MTKYEKNSPDKILEKSNFKKKTKMQYFYDENKMFWLWDEDLSCWKMCDDVALLNVYQEKTEQEIIKSKERQEAINLLKQQGRKNKPKPAPTSWIQFKKEIYDLKTGEQFSATPEYFVTNPLPYKIGSADETPTINKMFGEWVIKEGVQDESYVKTLFEILTYTSMSIQHLQRVIALTGSGQNGKGTFQNLIKRVLGEKNIAVSNLKLLSSRFETSGIYKKLACFFGDVDSYDLTNTNVLKSLTGEDLLRYEFKGKNQFTDYSYASPIIATNSLPITPDKSKAFYRRFLVVDFPNEFPLKRDLLNEVPEIEWENLMLKITKIAKELYDKDDFTNGGTIEERETRYEQRSHPLIQFIKEKCYEGEGFIKLREFTENLNSYLKNKNLKPLSIHRIGKLLREEGYEIGSRHFDNDESFKAVLNLSFTKLDKQAPLITTQTTKNRPTLHYPICSECGSSQALFIEKGKSYCEKCIDILNQ